jgi:osmotically-inducible protein OsmY
MRNILIVFAMLFIVNGCTGNSSLSTASPVAFVEDSVLEAKVKTALINQLGLADAFKIEVEAKDGVVQLSGFINNEVNKELAGQVARNVDGVKEVVNNIIVKP